MAVLVEDILAWQRDEGGERMPNEGAQATERELNLVYRLRRLRKEDLSEEDRALLASIPGFAAAEAKRRRGAERSHAVLVRYEILLWQHEVREERLPHLA